MKQLLSCLFAPRRIFDKPLPFTIGQGRKGADALAQILSQKQTKTKTKKHNGNENN